MRNELFTGIYNHVIANADSKFSQALQSGESFYVGEAEQGAAYPYAVCFIVSEVSTNEIGGTSTEIEWQVNGYSRSFTEVNNLASWCRELFENQYITVNNCQRICSYSATFGAIREDDSDPWQVSITFTTLAGDYEWLKINAPLAN